MKTIIYLLALSMFLLSCGKQIKNPEGEGLASSAAYLDNKQYEKAIEELEELNAKFPENRKLQVKLAHAYAGAGGFEAIEFAETIKKIETTELKENNQDILTKVRSVLDIIPNLSEHQRERLSQAINLYNDLGLDPSSTSKENNFKWGVLHAYRLLVTVKDVAIYTEDLVKDHEKYSEEEVQEFFMNKGDLLAKDIYQSYLMFKNSFKKLENIANKVESLIAKTINNKDFKIIIKGKARNYKEFIQNLINENSVVISEAISKIADKIKLSDFNGSIKRVFLGFRENEDDVNKRFKKIEILVRLFLDNVILKHPQKNEELKAIFTEELQEKAEIALRESAEERNLSPLKQFIEDQDSSIKTITDTWEILMAEHKQSEIELIIEPEVEVLLSYINKEEAKILKSKAKEVGLFAKNKLENAAEEMKEINKDVSRDLGDMIEDDAYDINNDVEASLGDLRDAVEEYDPELNEKGNQIINEEREFIEQ